MIPTPNLIPGSVVARRTAAAWRVRWMWGVGVITVLVGVVAGIVRADAEGGLGADRDKLARLETALLESERHLPGLRAEVARAKRLAGAATVLSDRPDWSLLLGALGSMADAGVVLESVSVEPLDASGRPAPPAGAVRVRITVAGLAPKQSDVQAFALELERSGLFDRTTPLGSRPRAIGPIEAVAFDVECEIGTGPIAGEGS